MSKEWGILYHHGGILRKDKGWSEKESDNPPDKFWEGEIENNLHHMMFRSIFYLLSKYQQN